MKERGEGGREGERERGVGGRERGEGGRGRDRQTQTDRHRPRDRDRQTQADRQTARKVGTGDVGRRRRTNGQTDWLTVRCKHGGWEGGSVSNVR